MKYAYALFLVALLSLSIRSFADPSARLDLTDGPLSAADLGAPAATPAPATPQSIQQLLLDPTQLVATIQKWVYVIGLATTLIGGLIYKIMSDINDLKKAHAATQTGLLDLAKQIPPVASNPLPPHVSQV